MCKCNNGCKMNSCPSFTANAMLVGDYEEADGSGNHYVERKRGGGMVIVRVMMMMMVRGEVLVVEDGEGAMM